MNDTNLDPNSNAAFSQNTGAQSNPFTGELKGEFSSDFGTNTNAVSQIFKSGGFASENKTKLILGAVAAIGILGAAYFFMSEPSEDEVTTAEEATDEEGMGEEGMAEMGDKPEDGAKPAEQAAPMEAAKPVADAGAAATSTGAITLTSPPDGAAQSYDETQGTADFQWEGPADQITFSRNQTMNPAVKVVTLNGASTYSFENPYPGTWYWQVKNSSGASDVRSFKISAPARRSFPVSQPTSGGSISGNGGVVSWQAGEKIARYSVEFTPAGQSFAAPAHRFGASGTSVAIQGVSPGSYDVRVGAFSEVAGRWEWQVIKSVTVQ
ncbi:MAG TPA: hypothetical protein VE954_26600 [Oligoflexus sp.]|uniref:hypothetical protein n=1 Tax=Oligoflexus sp. TaxID=1971216 RepID=UPI002D257B58|nr:hypothetical protein [Oligoflexus sp.]HYX36696.1 hypothetical protein [Oligoflexus sp.]